jgi:hypothetical protein
MAWYLILQGCLCPAFYSNISYECGAEGSPSLTDRKAMEQYRVLKTTVRKERMNGYDPWDGNKRDCENKVRTSLTRTETVDIKKPK